MTFTEYLNEKEAINQLLDCIEAKLALYPRSECGLVLDEFKDKDWHITKKQLAEAFTQLQRLNQFANKNYKKEVREYYLTKRFSKCTK